MVMNANGAAVRQLALNIFGVSLPLIRHGMEEAPKARADQIAYVEFARPSVLKVARWHGAAWVDEKLRPFDDAPVAWYSIGGARD